MSKNKVCAPLKSRKTSFTENNQPPFDFGKWMSDPRNNFTDEKKKCISEKLMFLEECALSMGHESNDLKERCIDFIRHIIKF